MNRKHNKAIVPNAKALRKNMTKEERHLWYDFLRDYPIKFLRQKILGNCIVDFYCASAKLVVELDGNQHYEDRNMEKDFERSEYLKGYDITVIRIPNNEVNHNFEAVCAFIDAEVQKILTAQRQN